jgi:uncharacterized protein (TIGR02145 family)
MKKQLTKFALTATLALAITLTLTACDEKKKQDGTDTKPPEAASEAEAAAEKPAENADGFKTVKIGSQVWMAENLNIETGNSKCYDNDPAKCQKYGRLYDWATAKTVCPSGWHLPSKAELEALEAVVGEKTVGKLLKATSGWNENGNGEDKFGFSALPGGSYNSFFKFFAVGEKGYWWSSTADGSSSAYILIMFHNIEGVYITYTSTSTSEETNFLSVRCIKD